MRVRYADVTSTIALVMAVGGVSYAAATLPANSVGRKQLRSKAVSSSKLASNAVTSSKLASGAVTASKLANDSVTTSKLGYGMTLSGATNPTSQSVPLALCPAPPAGQATPTCNTATPASIGSVVVNLRHPANVSVTANATFAVVGPANSLAQVTLTGAIAGGSLSGGSTSLVLAASPLTLTYQGFAAGLSAGSHRIDLLAGAASGVSVQVAALTSTISATALPGS